MVRTSHVKSPMRPISSIAALALAVATTALLAPAHAQDPAAAESLFQAGRTLAEEGKWAEACDKFAASFQNDATIGTAFNLGECSERQGKVGSAYTWFSRAKAMCDEKKDARGDIAEERRAKLEPRVPHLLVRSKTKAQLEVRLDGEPVDLAAVTSEAGLDGVVDPGEHRVEVRRGGEVLSTKKAKLDEAQRETIELDLAEIERTHPVDTAPPPPPPEPPPSQVPRYIGWALVGTGGLALVGATILEVAALGEQSDSEEPGHCLGTLCTPTGAEESATAGDLAEAGQWIGVAGLGLLAVGVTLVIATPSAKPTPPNRERTAGQRLAPGEVGLRAGVGRVSLSGTF
jgi:hypothetical protein